MGQIAKNRVQGILRLHTEAKAYANASKLNAEMALKSAWECGRELEEIRDYIPHGSWERWCKETIPEISSVTIWRYRRLAKEFPELPDKATAGSIRQAYLQLGLAAEDGAEDVERPADVKVKGGSSVLNLLNGLVRWLNEEHSKVPLHERDDRERQRLRREFRPVYEHLQKLFANPPGKESLSRR